jgi:hypothetical protein
MRVAFSFDKRTNGVIDDIETSALKKRKFGGVENLLSLFES